MKKFICELTCFFLLLGIFLISGAAVEASLPLWLCAVTNLILCCAVRLLYLAGEGRLHQPAQSRRAAVRYLPAQPPVHTAHGRSHHLGAA